MYNMMHSQCMIANLTGGRLSTSPLPLFICCLCHYQLSIHQGRRKWYGWLGFGPTTFSARPHPDLTRLLLTLLRGPLPRAVRHQPRNLDFPEPKFWEG